MKGIEVLSIWKGVVGAACLSALSVCASEAAVSAPSVAVSGQLTVDHIWAWETASDRSPQYPSSSRLRRALIGVSGSLGGPWGYYVDHDFSGSEPVGNAYVEYARSGFSVAMGQISPPSGLSAGESSRFRNTFEVAVAENTFAANDGLGLFAAYNVGAVRLEGAIWQPRAGVSVYQRGQIGSREALKNVHVAARDPLGVGTRVTMAPILEPDRVVHFGVTAWHQEPHLGEGVPYVVEATLPMRGRSSTVLPLPGSTESEFQTWRSNSISPAYHQVQHLRSAGVEFAAIQGPASVQAEWHVLRVGVSPASKGKGHFKGGYLNVAYSLTGETKDYDANMHVLRGISATGPNGSVELFAAYDWLDLRGKSDDGTPTGMIQKGPSVGVNWYVNPNVRWSCQYSRVYRARGVEAVTDDDPLDCFGAHVHVAFG